MLGHVQQHGTIEKVSPAHHMEWNKVQTWTHHFAWLALCADSGGMFTLVHLLLLQVIVAERGPIVFVFNWSPYNDYEGLKVATPEPGKYRVVVDSDALRYGGKGRVGWEVDHFTQPEPTLFNDRNQSMQVGGGSWAGGVHGWVRLVHVVAETQQCVKHAM